MQDVPVGLGYRENTIRSIPDSILSALRRWFARTAQFDRELIFSGAKALLGRDPDNEEVKELEAFADKQLAFMANFRNELEANPPPIIDTGPRIQLIRPGKPPMSPAQVGARMELYANATHQAAQKVQRGSKARNGSTRWERLIMGHPKTEHCSECPPDAALGWVPFGTLKPIGDRECEQLCLCHFEYSDSVEIPTTKAPKPKPEAFDIEPDDDVHAIAQKIYDKLKQGLKLKVVIEVGRTGG